MSAPVPGEPSEQVFSEAAREAAASAISGEFGYGDCFAACDLEGGHERERWLQLAAASLAAAVDADPRAKACLKLAALTDEEREQIVADIVGPRIDIRCGQCAGTGSDLRSNLDCTPCKATGYVMRWQPWRERQARELAAEVLAALGLPVAEQEAT